MQAPAPLATAPEAQGGSRDLGLHMEGETQESGGCPYPQDGMGKVVSSVIVSRPEITRSKLDLSQKVMKRPVYRKTRMGDSRGDKTTHSLEESKEMR